MYRERVALLLLNGVIYTGWASHYDVRPYTGWIMGYGESTLAQTSVLNVTPNGNQGAIWMSGAGLAADASGNIYFLDGNGTFDSDTEFQRISQRWRLRQRIHEAFHFVNGLSVADYFEMDNQAWKTPTIPTSVPAG